MRLFSFRRTLVALVCATVLALAPSVALAVPPTIFVGIPSDSEDGGLLSWAKSLWESLTQRDGETESAAEPTDGVATPYAKADAPPPRDGFRLIDVLCPDLDDCPDPDILHTLTGGPDGDGGGDSNGDNGSQWDPDG